MKNILEFSAEVAAALQKQRPIVALESTIISHGMPYPQNVETARHLEDLVRAGGAIPATICLMDGKIKIGLSASELELLATADGVQKVSRRDLGACLASRKIGATTVAATMIAAKLAGIKVFATGGIGGVHRFAAESFDISADLLEFSRSDLIVVAAGVKAILDIPKTLEYLETIGVPVYGYQTDIFPAFYSVGSNSAVAPIQSVAEIAEIFQQNQLLGFSSGMIIANPIPPQYEIPFAEMSGYIESALQAAQKQQISGQAVTPFLLAKLVELTKGRSLQTNIHLVENNVKLAAKIAVKLAE
ncbi:MAG: pseudouridine-5'-phosphate glycosidase [Candidatus Cloacimonadales bacterium]